MKKIALSFLFLPALMFLVRQPASAQKLAIGEKAPELKVKEWIGSSPSEGVPLMVAFVNVGSVDFDEFDRVAVRFKDRMGVAVCVNGSRSEVDKALLGGLNIYVTADEGGRLSQAWGVRFVPYCVIIDARSRVQWFGGQSQLSDELIGQCLAQ